MQDNQSYLVNQSTVPPSISTDSLPPQTSPTVPLTRDSHSWQIENLIKLAFKRTKERFISYFLAAVLSFIIGIAAVTGFLILGGFLFFLFSLTKSLILLIIFGAVFLFCLIIAFFYINSWTQLATVGILIKKDKMGVVETFKHVRPFVWGYLWFSFLYFIFIIGLLPIGLLSLSIVLILWSFWGSFSIFVYLTQKRHKGLDYLWLSRSMINQRFWGIIGRMLLIGFALLFINILLISSRNSILGLGSMLFSVISQPFVISFNYEMYRLLAVPPKIEKPKIWVGLSVVGWVVGFIILVLSFVHLMRLFSSLKYMLPLILRPALPKTRML